MFHDDTLTVPPALRGEYILFLRSHAKKQAKRIARERKQIEEIQRRIACRTQEQDTLLDYARDNGIDLSSD